MIHMFDLMPGASRQNEATTLQHKTNLTEISVCRAGHQEDQYIVFIDEHRDLFCATVKRIQNQDEEIYKIGNRMFSNLTVYAKQLLTIEIVLQVHKYSRVCGEVNQTFWLDCMMPVTAFGIVQERHAAIQPK